MRPATVFFIGTSACFIEALERSLAFAGRDNYQILIRDKPGVCQAT